MPKNAPSRKAETPSKMPLMKFHISTIGILTMSAFIIFIALEFTLDAMQKQMSIIMLCGFSKIKTAAAMTIAASALGIAGGIIGVLLEYAIALLMHSAYLPSISNAFLAIMTAFVCAASASFAAMLSKRKHATQTTNGKATQWIAGISALSLLSGCVALPIPRTAMVQTFCVITPVCLISAFIMLTPTITHLCEYIFSPPLAKSFRLNPLFIKNALSGNRWQNYRIILAFSVGLWLFISIHIWSSSMLTLFRIPDNVPDILIRCHPDANGDEMRKCIKEITGDGQCLKLAVAQPKLSSEIAQSLKMAGALADNIIVIGIEKMPNLPCIEGNATYFNAEDSCIIPESLAVNANLHVGDIVTLQSGKQLKVAGVVSFPWAWFSKCTGLRVHSGRTAGVIFAPYSWVLAELNAPPNEFHWIAPSQNIPFNQIETMLKNAAAKDIESVPIEKRRKVYSGGTIWDSGINTNYVQVSSNQTLNASLSRRSDSVISSMLEMPVIILVLSTIAVACTFSASIKRRQRDFRIMRLCGLTRGALTRLVIAESILVGIASCTISLSFGMFYGYISIQMMEAAPIFGLTKPPFVFPFSKILSGIFAALSLILLCGMSCAIGTHQKSDIAVLR